MTNPSLPRIEINRCPAGVDALGVLALGSYGHFTAMQVRGRRTRGLDLHLQRLDAATRELFGRPLDGDLFRDHVRHALGDDIDDASVRGHVFRPEQDGDVSIMVTVRPPAQPPGSTQRLRSVPYQRPVAHLKHMGGFAQEYYRRQAHRNGFDEALLTGPGGVVSEGAITNIGCWDGSTVVWPDAPMLRGITMQLLERGLAGLGVPSRRSTVRLRDLASFEAVFVTNSHGIAPVERVDDLTLPVAVEFMNTLNQILESTPWEPI